MPRPLDLLRDELARRGLDAFLVPHGDEWLNEFQPPSSMRLRFLTGFTGSAGVAIVTADRAALFVDGRYTLQAPQQAPDFELRHLLDDSQAAFLVAALPGGAGSVGYDPRLFSEAACEKLRASLQGSGAVLTPVATNPVDTVWHDRPPQPRSPARAHPLAFAGVAAAEKRAQLASALQAAGADALVVTAPDLVAWLFNLRGADIEHLPVVLATAILRSDGSASLFLDPARLDDATRGWLGGAVAIHPPASFGAALAALGGCRVLVDPALLPAFVFDRLRQAGAELCPGSDPARLLRACKNEVEIAGARAAHVQDGLAMVRFLAWLARHADTTDELRATARLDAVRRALPGCRDLSFPTISAVGPNAALVHYVSDAATNRRLEPGTLYLVDSGGQYDGGTTDVTRTIAIGTPSQEMAARFTQVLQGHVALATVRFPAGTTGQQLDVLARLALWRAGCDYDHGTGHGVGAYLSVHEGPQRIAKDASMVALLPGMILSNEPSFYAPGRYGIRTENLMLVRPAETVAGGPAKMLSFETLTLVPIDRALIDVALLTAGERDWIDAYHARVFAALADALAPDERAWLAAATAPLAGEVK